MLPCLSTMRRIRVAIYQVNLRSWRHWWLLYMRTFRSFLSNHVKISAYNIFIFLDGYLNFWLGLMIKKAQMHYIVNHLLCALSDSGLGTLLSCHADFSSRTLVSWKTKQIPYLEQTLGSPTKYRYPSKHAEQISGKVRSGKKKVN